MSDHVFNLREEKVGWITVKATKSEKRGKGKKEKRYTLFQ